MYLNASFTRDTLFWRSDETARGAAHDERVVNLNKVAREVPSGR